MFQDRSEAEQERFNKFVILRSDALRASWRDLKLRIEHGSEKKSAVEEKLGVFVESLEPQVRDAVIEINEKGYLTDDSGFDMARKANIQVIHGTFDLSPETVAKIESIGARVNQSGLLQSISFEPLNANMDEIKQKWAEIAEILPDLNTK